jgi:hypothetical protein
MPPSGVVFPIYGNAVGITKANNEIKTLPSGFDFILKSDSLAPVAQRAKDANRFEINPLKLKEGDTLYRPLITSDSLFVKLLGEAVGKEIALSTADDTRFGLPFTPELKRPFTKAYFKTVTTELQRHCY